MKKEIGGKAPFRTALLMVAMFAGTVAPLAVRADGGGDDGDRAIGGQEYYGDGRYDDERVPSPVLIPARNKTPKTTADGARYFRDAVDVPDSVQVIGSRPGPARYVRAVVPTPVVTSPPERTVPVVEVPVAYYEAVVNQPGDRSDRVAGLDFGDFGDVGEGSSSAADTGGSSSSSSDDGSTGE